MIHFSAMPYQRPDGDLLLKKLEQCIQDMKSADSFEEMHQLYLSQEQESLNWDTMSTLASIRYSIDTNDSFYEGETAYFDQLQPQIALLSQQLGKVVLNSPYQAQWEAAFGSLFWKNLEARQTLCSPEIVEELVQEAELCRRYSRLSASAETEFLGKQCNFYGLLKEMQNPNRSVRKAAMMAWGDLYQSIAPELDQLYDKMVSLRCTIAKKLGFSSYIPFAYLKHGRYDYSHTDVAAFRKQVKEVIVPLCQQLRDKQAQRLGIDQLHYYDESLIFPEGNAIPQGDWRELVEKARAMYHKLSPETGEFFDLMADYQLFDLETRRGKRPGGYCTFLPGYGVPFIFSNFNGTSADIDVLTHEAGHAFQCYSSASQIPLMEMIFPTSEAAEIHSMTMEHFAYPYMEYFFGEQANHYRYAHLMDALEVIPYMVCVDEFQHRVFEAPDMTAAERRKVWHQLEQTYLPWRDYDGHPFLAEGGFWMQKQHIFLYPFYYIDYALAQMGAFQLYGRMKLDHSKAWADYYKLCQAGGSKGYFQLLKLADLDNPFAEGTVEKVISSIAEEILQAQV